MFDNIELFWLLKCKSKGLRDFESYLMAINKNLFMMVVIVTTEAVAGVIGMPV